MIWDREREPDPTLTVNLIFGHLWNLKTYVFILFQMILYFFFTLFHGFARVWHILLWKSVKTNVNVLESIKKYKDVRKSSKKI